jgi:hypothetical protein
MGSPGGVRGVAGPAREAVGRACMAAERALAAVGRACGGRWDLRGKPLGCVRRVAGPAREAPGVRAAGTGPAREARGRAAGTGPAREAMGAGGGRRGLRGKPWGACDGRDLRSAPGPPATGGGTAEGSLGGLAGVCVGQRRCAGSGGGVGGPEEAVRRERPVRDTAGRARGRRGARRDREPGQVQGLCTGLTSAQTGTSPQGFAAGLTGAQVGTRPARGLRPD